MAIDPMDPIRPIMRSFLDVNLTEIDRSGFLLLLQDQKLLQNQKQKLLPDTGAPVGTGAPVHIGAPV